MTLDVQFQTMLVMTLGGFYLGISLDTFRRFSYFWHNRIVWKYMCECLFWLLQTFILFYVLYIVNAGELRFYIFVACLFGFSIYQALFASIYKKWLEKCLSICRVVVCFLLRFIKTIFIQPIKWVCSIVLSVLLFFLRLGISIISFFLRPVVKWLIALLNGVYQYIPTPFQRILYKIARFYSIIKNTLKR